MRVHVDGEWQPAPLLRLRVDVEEDARDPANPHHPHRPRVLGTLPRPHQLHLRVRQSGEPNQVGIFIFGKNCRCGEEDDDEVNEELEDEQAQALSLKLKTI